MDDSVNAFETVLRADAERRRALAESAATEPPADNDAPLEGEARRLRIRFLNSWPRQVRPVFQRLRADLSPHDYTLAFPHLGGEGPRLRLQTVLERSGETVGASFAPLVFELDDHTGFVRVFVQQFGGRLAPDFPQTGFSLHDAADEATLATILRDYVVCMIRPLLTRPSR
jgi:hypothetical protein